MIERLREIIRELPPGVEFLIVVSWAFGLPIFSSILIVSGSDYSGRLVVYNNEALLSILIFEILQSAFLLWFLHVRGWTLEKFGLRLSWQSTGMGVVLLLITWCITLGAGELAKLALPIDMHAAASRYPRADPTLSMQLVFLASTVNSIFEEVFVAGYVITVLTQARGLWTAINVSTVVRLLYHLYQGPLGVITIVPLGLLYGYTFARTRQLWPLIVAHVCIDIVSLSLVV